MEMENRSASAAERCKAPGLAGIRLGQTQTKTNSLANIRWHADMKLSTEIKIYGFFFAAASAGILILGTVTYDSTQNLMVTDNSVSHTLQVRDSLEELLSAVLGAENGRRGYLLTGDSQYQLQFEACVAQIRPDVKKTELLTANEPDQRKTIAALIASTEETISIWEETTAHLQKGKGDAAQQIELTNKGAEGTARIIGLLA